MLDSIESRIEKHTEKIAELEKSEQILSSNLQNVRNHLFQLKSALNELRELKMEMGVKEETKEAPKKITRRGRKPGPKSKS